MDAQVACGHHQARNGVAPWRGLSACPGITALSAWHSRHAGNPRGGDTWRRVARDLSCAWHEWSAAGGDQRAALYHRYACLLIAEAEAAAELQRSIEASAGNRAGADLPEPQRQVYSLWRVRSDQGR